MPAKGFRLSPFGGAGGGSADAQFVVLALSADLTAERVLTGTANQIIITDNGANSTVVLSLPQDIDTVSSPTFVDLTLSGLTEGSVLFSGPGGLISEDNASFFWDDSSNELGIGTNTPGATLVVQRNNDDAAGVGLYLTANSTSPTTNDVVGTISFRGKNSTGSELTYGRISYTIADPLSGAEDGIFKFDSTINGVILTFFEAANYVNIGNASDDIDISLLSQVGSPAVFVDSSTGNVGMGTNAPSAKLHAIKTTEQARFGYDTSNYSTLTMSSTGRLTIGLVGSNQTIAIGNSAGASQTATNGVFIGQNAGANATTTTESIFIGRNAGQTALQAANSIFIGVNAGDTDAVNNSSSGTSIAIGRYAGTGGFKDSIAIGHGVANSAVNQLNIGNVFYATALYASDSQSSTPITTATYKLPGFTSAGFVKTSSAGLLSVDTASYQPLDATLTSLAAIAGVQGDIIYASGTDAWTRLAKSTTATRYLANTGTSNNPAWAQINLANGVTGTLPVGNGGTGTATAFTLGSVIFAGASGVYTQDNANFFYDNSTDRLGLGTATPDARLDVVVSAIANTKTDGIVLQNETAATVGAQLQYSPRLRWKGSAWKSNATAASQTQEWAADVLTVAGTTQTSSSLSFWNSNNGGGFSSAVMSITNGSSAEYGTSGIGIGGYISALISTDSIYPNLSLGVIYNNKKYYFLQSVTASGSGASSAWGASLLTTNASFNTILTIPVSDTSYNLLNVTVDLNGGEISGSGDMAGYKFVGTFKNVSGTLTQIGTTTVLHSVEDDAATDFQFTISGTNILVQVKGINLESWQWGCNAVTNEITAGGLA